MFVTGRSKDILQSNVTPKFLACVLGVTLVLSILTLSGRWCWCADLGRMMRIICFVVVQLQHVGFHPLTDTDDTAFHFPDGNLG